MVSPDRMYFTEDFGIPVIVSVNIDLSLNSFICTRVFSVSYINVVFLMKDMQLYFEY